MCLVFLQSSLSSVLLQFICFLVSSPITIFIIADNFALRALQTAAALPGVHPTGNNNNDIVGVYGTTGDACALCAAQSKNDTEGAGL